MYEHIDHKLTRDMLEMGTGTAKDMKDALNFALSCLIEDEDNEDVSYRMYYDRVNLLKRSQRYYNEGDITNSIVQLRIFWGV